MRLSNMGLSSNKINLDNNDMFYVQQILMQTSQLYKYASGVFALSNIPLLVKQKVENIIREEFKKAGLVEVLLPLLHPIDIWKESDRFEKYINDQTMLTTKSSSGEFALAPTAEEAAINFVSDFVKSYKQLPITIYQIGEKFRNELRNRGHLFRGKCFTMMDAYSFDESFENLEKTYQKIRESYIKIFNRIYLNVMPVIADSGSMGGKKSEEFMLIHPFGEDTILYNKEKNLALNSEILEKKDYKEFLLNNYNIDSLEGFEKTKSIELGHIFQLGTYYSEKMQKYFATRDEKSLPFVMGCYGIGITRLVATLFEINKIEKDGKVVGCSLPLEIAPYVANIIYSENKENDAKKIYEKLEDQNIDILIDDRKDKKLSFGSRINTTYILGIPYNIILGNKVEENFAELENTKTNKKLVVEIDKLINAIILSSKEKISIEEALIKTK